MTRHVVICTDGTWNTPDQRDRGRQVPSNVVKISRALGGRNATSGIEQILYYDTGVGTGGTWDRLKGGAFGVGLSVNVLQAYSAIGAGCREADRLFLFGFSRGAYTARSLAGLIGLCGIPDPHKGALETTVQAAYAIYRMDPIAQRDARAAAAREHVSTLARTDARGEPMKEIWFIGVWDTVGALGVPLQKLNWLGQRKFRFHDVELGEHVRHAYHAIAIDERRRPFAPALWLDRGRETQQSVQQLWFVGVHTNIGGGYVDSGLSDRALLWMCAKAKAAGLALNDAYMHKRLDPNYHGEVRDSMSVAYRALVPLQRPLGGRWPIREGGELCPVLNEGIHYSAAARYWDATEAIYRGSPGATGLGAALRAQMPPVVPPLVEESDFHLGVAGIAWEGDGSSPALLQAAHARV